MNSVIKTFDIFARRNLTCIKLVYTNNTPLLIIMPIAHIHVKQED